MTEPEEDCLSSSFESAGDAEHPPFSAPPDTGRDKDKEKDKRAAGGVRRAASFSDASLLRDGIPRLRKNSSLVLEKDVMSGRSADDGRGAAEGRAGDTPPSLVTTADHPLSRSLDGSMMASGESPRSSTESGSGKSPPRDSPQGYRSASEGGSSRGGHVLRSQRGVTSSSEARPSTPVSSLTNQRSHNGSASNHSLNKSDGKKKRSARWALSPSYKSKCDDFKKLFRDLVPADDRLVVDHSCALQKDILVQGRMYVSQQFICFYANIFKWETTIAIPCKDVKSITKEKTARLIPNAIQVVTEKEKYFFTSFHSRDKVFRVLFRVWQHALLNEPMPGLWRQIHSSYGEDLGLTSSDDDYVAPDDNRFSPRRAIAMSSLPEVDLPPSEGNPAPLAQESPLHKGSVNGTLVKGEEQTDENWSIHESDTSEDMSPANDEPVQCTCGDHPGTTQLDASYSISVDVMFQLLFTDCPFYRNFCKLRRMEDVSLGEWREEGGRRVRSASYVVPTNNPLGPKSTASREEMEEVTARSGEVYVIEACVSNSGIPYADHFTINNRYCLTRVSSRRCRLLVTSRVTYKRNVWGLIKNFIDKNCTSGLAQHYNLLDSALLTESERLSSLHEVAPSRNKKLQHRRRSRAPGPQDSCRGTEAEDKGALPSAAGTGATAGYNRAGGDGWQSRQGVRQGETGGGFWGADNSARILCILVVLLLLLNVHLYTRLSVLERLLTPQLHHADPSSPFTPFPPLTPHPAPPADAAQKWRHLLDATVTMMGQMKATLQTIREHLPQDADHPPR